MMRRSRVLTTVFLGLCLLLGTAYAEDKKKPVRPPTKQTQVLRTETYKKLEEVQKRFDAKDYSGALKGLDDMKSRFDKLNDYEKATLWNFYAIVYYSQNDTAKAIEAYLNVLKQNNLPEGLRDGSLYALAQMYFLAEDYPKAIAVLKKWLGLVQEAQPDAHVLMAQAYYQLKRYRDAEQAILDALRIAKSREQKPKENWLALLRAVYYELENYPRSAKVLEILVAHYPKQTYWLQLSGMYGLMGKPKEQLKTLHAAHAGGMVTREADLLNLARLYLSEDAPYPAVKVLAEGFKKRVIKEDAGNLQLYAQALGLAKEYETQIPALKRLAETSGESKHYVYLGQAYNELGNWADAAAAFRAAVNGKNLKDASSVRMQLATALFNAGKLSEAREIFVALADDKKIGEMARNWVKFVSSEIQRKQALKAS